jgi:glycerol kinase
VARGSILAIDQGTTSTRAIVFDGDGHPRATAQRELPQIFPDDGWVEHDPEEIWRATLAVAREALAGLGAAAAEVAAIGITNQRETTVLWERATGKPLHNAIVWQDRRGTPLCRRLEAEGQGSFVQSRTGLLLDPYFSASKIAWMLENIPGARARAERGELAMGTIDSFLLWRLTGGRVHATDATNASRTLLFDIHRQQWDDDLLALFGVPRALLPEVMDTAAAFGSTAAGLLDRPLPILAMVGDQQAAGVGQACVESGMIKSTYGTGCFVLLNSGDTAPLSKNRLVTTVAARIRGHVTYAVEGSIFVAGAAVQWLRDRLKFIAASPEAEAIAAALPGNAGVYLVPAFTGLGAPYWEPEARGALFGLTRDVGRPEIVRAALEAVCYQTLDLMRAMAADGAPRPRALRVDGGMSANDWLMQFLADILDLPVERPMVTETTALGAAYLAGLEAGLYASTAEIGQRWRRDRLFEPRMAAAERDRLYAGWQDAVMRVRR